MLINFGMHEGKSVERIVLTEPGYTVWILGQTDPRGRMARVAGGKATDCSVR